jgi:hypothetical protein
MELTAAVLAYMMHGQVEMTLIRTMNESFMMYNDNERPYITNGIDFMQSHVSRIDSDASRNKRKTRGSERENRKLDPGG